MLAPREATAELRVLLEDVSGPCRLGLYQDGVCVSSRFIPGPGAYSLFGRAGRAQLRWTDDRTFTRIHATTLDTNAATELRIPKVQ